MTGGDDEAAISPKGQHFNEAPRLPTASSQWWPVRGRQIGKTKGVEQSGEESFPAVSFRKFAHPSRSRR